MDTYDTIILPIKKEFEMFKLLFLDSLKSEDELLNRVLQYIAQRTGKSMRPILALLLAKTIGPVNDLVFQGALSLELLHTASLIHDDVVDDSMERRGLPSVQSVFDNKVAVLVGDYLLASSLSASSKTSIEIVNAVSEVGLHLTRGELLQLSNIQTDSFSEESYYKIIRGKTASLFAACGKVAALANHVSPDIVNRYALFGELVGIIFQIRDDIFDYKNDIQIGKPTSNDMREGKLTLPAIFALNKSNNPDMHALAYSIRARRASEEEISLFTSWVISMKGIEYAEQKMNEFCQDALSLLQDIKDPQLLRALNSYVCMCMNRSK